MSMSIFDRPTLKLVDPDGEEFSDVLPMERRTDSRFVISGRVTAVRASRPQGERLNKICSLQLLNMSDTGVGAISQEPIEPGSSISIFFPPHGPEQGFDTCGEVVRCTARPGEQGYDIGVRMYARAAA